MPTSSEDRGRFEVLRDAVRRLYYSAYWISDRSVNAAELWSSVRDAAGFPNGGSPIFQPFDGIRAEYSIDRLRSIGTITRRIKGGDPVFTSVQARAFLQLHSKELNDRLDQTLRDFFKEKL